LLRRILNETSVERLRISSIEPLDVTRDVVELFASTSRLAPGLPHAAAIRLQSYPRCHAPLVSRGYARRGEFIRELLPNAALGADIITAFPGETEEDHAATLRFIDSLPFTYLHVFSYSQRPGTKAAAMPNQLSGSIIKHRARELRTRAEAKSAAFRDFQQGRELRVLTLRRDPDSRDQQSTPALSEIYLNVRIPAPLPPNELLTVTISGSDGKNLLASPTARVRQSAKSPLIEKHMNFLGISSLGHGSAVALLNEQGIVFAIEEEKLNRLQDSTDVPRLSLDRCLLENHLKLSDCRAIGLADRTIGTKSSRSSRKRFPHSAAYDRLIHLLRGGSRPSRFDHHLCHAASAYYTSGYESSLILTLDEGTGSQSGLIALGESDEIKPLHTFKFPDSLAWFFTRVTELAGLRPHRDEHKMQWLSKDGQPEFLPAFRKMFNWRPSGVPALNRRYYASGPDHVGVFAPQFYRELGLSSRGNVLTPATRANIARSLQDLVEEIVLQFAVNFREQTGVQSLCLAGGLFLNVLLVRALEARGGFENVYVQPVSGNAGTALGAAYLSRKKVTGRSSRAPLPTLSLGMCADSHEIKAVLDNCKISYRYLSGEDETVDETVGLLQRDKIVGWCQGRSEFGHRALGYRSLLASPFSEYMVENVNQYIKHREEFHPFALSIPTERAADYFQASPNCRFMASLATLTNPVAGLERFSFLGNAVRVHTVDKESNPLFWKLLHKFGESAPAPILVNTSFNLFGEPLVTDPRGAVRSFYCAGIDALAMGSFLLVK
jgi:carbamoyltransferase